MKYFKLFLSGVFAVTLLATGLGCANEKDKEIAKLRKELEEKKQITSPAPYSTTTEVTTSSDTTNSSSSSDTTTSN